MMMPAEAQTFAPPEMPCDLTAAAMKGIVTLEVPPMRTALRPSRAQIGAVMMEVYAPSTGGKPISKASARP
jgi:hypothetical protein